MTIQVHVPTLLVTLTALLASWAAVRGLEAHGADGAAMPVRCDRYDVLVREHEDLEAFAEMQRAQVEAVLTKLHSGGYIRMLWADSYNTSYVAGEAHYIGFVCMALQ